jgi:flagellar protein FlaG
LLTRKRKRRNITRRWQEMTIEPMGSIMSVQAQSYQTKKPVVSDTGRVHESPEAIQDIPKLDKTTSVVDTSRGKEFSEGDTEQQSQSQLREQSPEQIKKAVEKLNKSMPHSEAIFGIHEATNRVMIKIVDKETKEVIKELPPEKTLDMISRVWELAGMLVDEKR